MTLAPSEDSNQPSLIRVFTVRMRKVTVPIYTHKWFGLSHSSSFGNIYNTSFVYCRELAPSTVSLTGDWVVATTVNNYGIIMSGLLIQTVKTVTDFI